VRSTRVRTLILTGPVLGENVILNAVYQAPNPELARTLATEFVTKYERDFPSAVRCFLDDLEACLAHLRCPEVHRKAIRTTNIIERGFVELRRRTKVIPRFFNEKSCLKLAFAELVRAGERARRVKMSEIELRQLAMLREDVRKERGQPARSTAPAGKRSVA
jgi:putative transposase